MYSPHAPGEVEVVSDLLNHRVYPGTCEGNGRVGDVQHPILSHVRHRHDDRITRVSFLWRRTQRHPDTRWCYQSQGNYVNVGVITNQVPPRAPPPRARGALFLRFLTRLERNNSSRNVLTTGTPKAKV